MTTHPAIIALRNVVQAVLCEHEGQVHSMLLDDLCDDESSINAHPASHFAWIVTPGATRLVWVDGCPVDGVMYIKAAITAYLGDHVEFYLWDGITLQRHHSAPLLIQAYKRARATTRQVRIHCPSPVRAADS